MDRLVLRQNHGQMTLYFCLGLVLIGTMVGLLVPSFLIMDTAQHDANRAGTALVIQMAINVKRVENRLDLGARGSYPIILDALPSPTKCEKLTPCFSGILTRGIVDAQWYKVGMYRYRYATPVGAFEYTYDPVSGVFESVN